MSNTESYYTTKIVNSFNKCGWIYKIPDSPLQSYSVPRPFDLIGCVNGKSFAIEVKSDKGFKAFNIKRLDRKNNNVSQLDELIRFEREGRGKGYLFLTVSIANDIFEGTKAETFLYWFRANEVRSIKADELKTLPAIKLVRGVFDISPIIEDILHD